VGDERRGQLFAQWITHNFPKSKNILDVAGGRGQVARKLANKKCHIHIVDAKPRFAGKLHPRISYEGTWFDGDVYKSQSYNLVIGMHPDEATGEIIRYAIKTNIPFAIVPCCIKGRDAKHISKFNDWIKHLTDMAKQKGFKIEIHKLKMQGKNTIITGKPTQQTRKKD